MEPHHEGLLLHARLAQDGVELGEGVLQDVVRADVNLGDHKEDGHLQGQGHSHVLLAHTHNSCSADRRPVSVHVDLNKDIAGCGRRHIKGDDHTKVRHIESQGHMHVQEHDPDQQ